VNTPSGDSDPATSGSNDTPATEVAAVPEEVLPSVARTVQTALRLPYVAVRVGDATVAEAGRLSSSACEEFPLVFTGETVRNNVSDIFAKIQVADRSDAIVKAREAGLGSLD
jgi:hypothetical protein